MVDARELRGGQLRKYGIGFERYMENEAREMVRILAHFLRGLQFKGFAGSRSWSQLTILEAFCCASNCAVSTSVWRIEDFDRCALMDLRPRDIERG